MSFTRNRLTDICPSNRFIDNFVRRSTNKELKILFNQLKRRKELKSKHKEIRMGVVESVPITGTGFFMKVGRLLRLPEVMERVGFSRSTIYDRMGRGTFPKSHKWGPRIVVWNEYEIDTFCAEVVK